MGTLGMIGFGRMGANMAERLRRAGHDAVGFDMSQDTARDVDRLEGLVEPCSHPALSG
jgi:6-phosphogluconate dehydrogenase